MKTSQQQKKAVDVYLGGEEDSLGGAMRAAGYGEKPARNPGHYLVRRKGTQEYIKKLDKAARQRWNRGLDDKVREVYLDGLDATKLVGKEAVEHPDHPTRKKYADRMAKFMGWIKHGEDMPPPTAQFNFFSVSEEKREQFNTGLKKLLARSRDL